jgi:hypothetical protein
LATGRWKGRFNEVVYLVLAWLLSLPPYAPALKTVNDRSITCSKVSDGFPLMLKTHLHFIVGMEDKSSY